MSASHASILFMNFIVSESLFLNASWSLGLAQGEREPSLPRVAPDGLVKKNSSFAFSNWSTRNVTMDKTPKGPILREFILSWERQ